MNITRDVVNDLLPVYLAGEASPDTRALVEEWLRKDPDLSRQVSAAKSAALPPVSMPGPTAERLALSKTRRWLRWRLVLVGTAIYVTTLPATVVFNRQGFQGLLLDEWPERVVVLLLAAALWVAFIAVARRVRTTGL